MNWSRKEDCCVGTMLFSAFDTGIFSVHLLAEVEMRKGYSWGHQAERNQDNPRLKSICGDNIKYPRVKKAVQRLHAGP